MQKFSALSLRHSSCIALSNLLFASIKNVNSTPADLSACLKSQAALAHYKNDTLGIFPCSLNTLKRSAVILPGGFEALNSARVSLQAALSEGSASPRHVANSKRQIAARNISLAKQLQHFDEDLLLLTRLLEMAMRQARSYAEGSKDSRVIARCAKEQDSIYDMLSLVKAAPAALKVV